MGCRAENEDVVVEFVRFLPEVALLQWSAVAEPGLAADGAGGLEEESGYGN